MYACTDVIPFRHTENNERKETKLRSFVAVAIVDAVTKLFSAARALFRGHRLY